MTCNKLHVAASKKVGGMAVLHLADLLLVHSAAHKILLSNIPDTLEHHIYQEQRS
jgi:hypothetical protein